MTDIQQFYNGQSVFITGGTGFLGKVLIEKLLRSCPGIKAIYILIRPKKGKEILQRVQQMTILPLFESLRAQDPNFAKKIIPLPGDVMKPDLGLSSADREIITKEVSIVFHSAATTRFDESLKIALKMNVECVQSIIDICRECKNLKALVYVSTAFSNCIYEHVEEKVYPAPLSPEKLSKVVQIVDRLNFTEKEEEKFTNLVIGKFPNTYCFTKAIAEDLISKNAKDLPVCIYRFSIALSTLREPVVGWLDTLQALTQTLLRIGKGIIRVICVKRNANMEVVPIDLACNCLIASAWETDANKKYTSQDLQVYNYVSGRDNPVKWNFLQEHLRKERYKFGVNKTIYYPDAMIIENTKLFFLLHYILHFIPAVLGDIFLRISGKKSKFYNVFNRGTKLITVIRFFTNGEWLFDTDNVKSLWNKLSDTDKKLFNFDITSFTWDKMLDAHCIGTKKYYLKDEMHPEAHKEVVRRLNMFFYIHQTVRVIFYSLVLWLVWKIYCLLFNWY